MNIKWCMGQLGHWLDDYYYYIVLRLGNYLLIFIFFFIHLSLDCVFWRICSYKLWSIALFYYFGITNQSFCWKSYQINCYGWNRYQNSNRFFHLLNDKTLIENSDKITIESIDIRWSRRTNTVWWIESIAWSVVLTVKYQFVTARPWMIWIVECFFLFLFSFHGLDLE